MTSGNDFEAALSAYHMTSIDRLGMASTLVKRADQHRLSIGDDHGDPYEAAILAGEVPDEMQLLVKEAIDHLRAALDYCSMHVVEYFGSLRVDRNVFFPIARKGAKEDDFRSLMNRAMPGVSSASPAAYTTFRDFQEFTSSANQWLPELATLANQAKHNHLEIAHLPISTLRIRRQQGVYYCSFPSGDSPRKNSGLTLLRTTVDADMRDGDYEVVILRMRDIEVELSTFLSEACHGVAEIVWACRKLAK